MIVRCQRRLNIPQKCRSKIPHLLDPGDQPASVICISVFCFGGPPAPLWRRWWSDGGVGPDMLGYEVGMAAEPVACPLDLDDHGVVQEPVEQRGRDDRIAEDLAPFREATVRGEE